MRILTLLLVIPPMIGFMATAPVASASAPLTPPAPGETQSPQRYTVQTGDTLWGIASSFGLSVSDLLTANQLTGREVLAVGRQLVLPPKARATGAGPTVVKTQPLQYVVRSGDTPWDVAVAYGVTVDALLAANRLGVNPVLAVGQVLVLPAGARAPRPAPKPAPAPAAPSLTATAPLTTTLALTTTAPGDAAAIQASEAITTPLASAPVDQPAGENDAVDGPDGVDEPVQAGAAITGTQTISATVPAANLPAAISDWPQQVFNGINAKRAAHGLPPLAWSPELAQAAQGHAEDCGNRGRGSHVGSDGASLRTRLARVGLHPGYTSENWVYTVSPQRGVDWWYNEAPGKDPHRRNILSPRYTAVGIGVAFGVEGHYYFIADFAGG